MNEGAFAGFRGRRISTWSVSAVALAMLCVGSFSDSARAHHTINPGIHPRQLSPFLPIPAGSPRPEGYASAPAYGCRRGPAAGAQAGTHLLALYLFHWVPFGRHYGIYNCRKATGSNSWSLHAEGRAFDLGLDAYNPWRKRSGTRSSTASSLALMRTGLVGPWLSASACRRSSGTAISGPSTEGGAATPHAIIPAQRRRPGTRITSTSGSTGTGLWPPQPPIPASRIATLPSSESRTGYTANFPST